MKFTDKGIVLAHENFGEADRYIQFFTQNRGLITVLGRSARKSKRRYVGGLDIFCHDEISLRGGPREKPYLNELTVLNSFPLIRDSLEKMLAGGKIVQWVRKLLPAGTPMPGVYSLLGQTLALIEKEGDPDRLELLTLVFKLKLLEQLGLKPRMDSCAKCGAPSPIHVVFDVEAGGVLCSQCSGGASLTERPFMEADMRSFLDLADRFRLTAWGQLNFPREKANYLLRLVTQFASFHTHTKLPI